MQRAPFRRAGRQVKKKLFLHCSLFAIYAGVAFAEDLPSHKGPLDESRRMQVPINDATRSCPEVLCELLGELFPRGNGSSFGASNSGASSGSGNRSEGGGSSSDGLHDASSAGGHGSSSGGRNPHAVSSSGGSSGGWSSGPPSGSSSGPREAVGTFCGCLS